VTRHISRGTLLACCLFVGVAPTPAVHAQDEPVYDRLARLFKTEELQLGVLLQTVVDLQMDRTAPGSNGFSIANFRLRVEGELDRKVGYFLQANFTTSPSILDARMSFRVRDWLSFDAGQFKAPFSREFLTPASSTDFINRASAVTALAPGRQLGLQARLGTAARTGTLAFGVFNGNGTRPNGNDNDNFLYAVRATVSPGSHLPQGSSLVFGVNAAHSDDARSTLGSGFVQDFAGTRTVLGGDVRAALGRYLFAGEAVYADLRPTTGVNRGPWGFHVTAGYAASAKTQLLMRWDGFDADDGLARSDVVILGVNIWPTKVTEMQANYLVDVRDTAFDRHRLLINFQFGF
jgi:Phosphate-selective porin O and P